MTFLILSLGLVACPVAVPAAGPLRSPGPVDTGQVARRPASRSGLDDAPPEVREFLGRVSEMLPGAGAGVTGYRFEHWKWPGKPTQEVFGLKSVPGVDPEALIARVMDVDRYQGHIAHVAACRSVPDPAFASPGKVRFFQAVHIPGVADVQQDLVLMDAGTIKGYRVAYWYLLPDATGSRNPKAAARSQFNVGAWVAGPGVVGYALSSWPRRSDVNALQWLSLTSGANALARSVVEGNIDGMAAWAKAEAARPRSRSAAHPRAR